MAEPSDHPGFLAPLGRGVEGEARDGEGSHLAPTARDLAAPSPALRATSPQRGEEPQSSQGTTILVCSSCRDETGSDARPRAGEHLADAASAACAGLDIELRKVECLGNCKRRLSAALLQDGCWSYVFGDLKLENAADLATAALLFKTTADGTLPWRGRPEALKRGLIARIPPLSKDLP